MKRFKTYFNPGKGAALNLENINLEHFHGGKRGLLERIRKTIEKFPNVQFNYTGHGIQPLNMREMDEVQALRPVRKPEVVSAASVSPTVPKYPTLPDDDDEDLQVKPIDPRAAQAENKFAIYTAECQACKTKCNKVDWSDCMKSRGKTNDSDGMCWSRVYRDFSSACSQTCLDKWCITKTDLENLFQGKNVFGVIDACHSGGLQGFKTLATSSSCPRSRRPRKLKIARRGAR